MIYPTLDNGFQLRAASSGGVLTEPQTTTIGASGYSEPVGFGNCPMNVEVESLGTQGAGEDVSVQVAGETTFANPTEHTIASISISEFAAGQTVRAGLQEEGKYVRFVNNGAAAVKIKIWRLPNRN